MTLDADQFIDRRRLKRRLRLWQIAAVVLAGLAVFAFLGEVEDDHVARITVEGIIFDDPDRADVLDKIAANPRAKALIVAIDSPGGTVVGGETIYRRLRAIGETIPVVAVMGDTATSAAYMAAVGADHIVARAGTVTGSIGVILQTADVTGLLTKLGVKPETVKSGPLKAQPNPLEPFSPAARAATESVIRDLHEMFVDIVAERRDLPRDRVAAMADGRIYSGRQAKTEGLVDAVGATTLAREWLAAAREVPETLPVKDMTFGREEELLRDLVEGMIGKALFSERLKLDGVISLWHPSGW